MVTKRQSFRSVINFIAENMESIKQTQGKKLKYQIWMLDK